jgi:hypothetical protein
MCSSGVDRIVWCALAMCMCVGCAETMSPKVESDTRNDHERYVGELLAACHRTTLASNLRVGYILHHIGETGPPTSATEAAFVWAWSRYDRRRTPYWVVNSKELMKCVARDRWFDIHACIQEAIEKLEARWDYRFSRQWMQDPKAEEVDSR